VPTDNLVKSLSHVSDAAIPSGANSCATAAADFALHLKMRLPMLQQQQKQQKQQQ